MGTASVRAGRNANDLEVVGVLLLARIVKLVSSVVAGVIVVGIALVVLEANPDNGLVSAVVDAARWLVGPFKNLFSLDDPKWTVAVNWGIAAAIYAAIGA